MRVAVVANDVTPDFGLPVAAPGLRAWATAVGLRTHGAEVTVVANRGPIQRLWGVDAPPPPQPMGPDTLSLPMHHLDGWVGTHRPDAVVFTNSNHVAQLRTDDVAIVYDFFAPKMLELSAGGHGEAQLAALRAQKLAGLGRADLVAVNGEKKKGYVRDWMRDAGLGRDVPLVPLPFGIPFVRGRERADGAPLRVGIAGYVQSWSEPGPWVDELLRVLDAVGDRIEVHLVLPQHWGGGTPSAHGEQHRRLIAHERTVVHDTMTFSAFREWVRGMDVSLDLFAHNDERELAMVTRTLVALCSGSAVVHPTFTEVSPLVERYDAGWLVGDEDGELERLLHRLVEQPDEVATARARTRDLTVEVLAPRPATRALHRRLEELL